jgi:hypothetical protein
MVEVWALKQLTWGGKTHEPGDPVELPCDTDQERAEFERYLTHGIVTRSAPKGAPVESDGAQRTARRSRRG